MSDDLRTDPFPPGTRVRVRTRFDESWSSLLEVAAVAGRERERAYRVRRVSDGTMLPAAYAADDLLRAEGNA
jgi:hypothetical protein